MRISIIGSGNVATHLAAALKNAGHRIIQVYSRNYQNAALLAYHVGAEAIDSFEQVDTATDFFIVAVKDDAITNVVESLGNVSLPIVHTSGSVSIDAISHKHKPAGVLYPLQTFSKMRQLDFSLVPLCLEASDEQTSIQLNSLAATISNHLYHVSSAQRKILHLAAVFACNFPNYLYRVANQLLADSQLDFNLIRPLILETALKVQENMPADVQTGPAVRNDAKTMEAHLGLLGNDMELQRLYSEISQRIIKMEIAKLSNGEFC